MSVSERFAVPRAVLFDKEQMKKIEVCLDELARDTGTQNIILTDITGQLIEFRGHINKRDAEALAALIAGSHAASTEFAKLLGKGAPIVNLTHETVDYSIYSVNVAESLILSVAFEKEIKIGIVRVFVEQARCRLAEIVHEVPVSNSGANNAKIKLVEEDFNDLLDKELEKILDQEEE
jgi:predicted regulator of Ras-like GTPase activity (Roadblock/LC7/MglB family)